MFFCQVWKRNNRKKYKIKKKKSGSLQSIFIHKIHAILPRLQRIWPDRRAALDTFGKGSFTVEAAWVLPVFILGCMAMFSVFDLYDTYVRESMKLKEKAEKMAMNAYEADLSKTLYPDGYITLSKIVSYRIPYAPAPLPVIRIPCYARVHAWVGYLGTEAEASDQSEESEMVFVSDYESVYHTSSSCSYLELSIHQESFQSAAGMLNAYGSHYKPCEKCIGAGMAQGNVYVTDHGDAYHNSLECSGLTRSLHLVKKENYQNLSCCERCAAGGNSH